jgi:hypothetical protein
MQIEVSPSPSNRIDSINKSKHFTDFHNLKSLRDITRQDIIDFLDSLRKHENIDPLHKWIGIHEIYRIVLLRFFRWLHCPSDDINKIKAPVSERFETEETTVSPRPA